jgi:hypothetical protein
MVSPPSKRSNTRGSMYDARHTAGVLPRKRATSSMARLVARLWAVLDECAASPDTARATAASTVAFQVRKSFALKSPLAAAFTYSLMSADFTSTQRRPSLKASSSGPPPRRVFIAFTTSSTSSSAMRWSRFCPPLAS